MFSHELVSVSSSAAIWPGCDYSISAYGKVKETIQLGSDSVSVKRIIIILVGATLVFSIQITMTLGKRLFSIYSCHVSCQILKINNNMPRNISRLC